MVSGTNCFDSVGGGDSDVSMPNSFPKMIGYGTGVTEVQNVDVAANGRIVIGVTTTETMLAGTDALTSKMVMMYDPDTDSYKWNKIILDAVDVIDVHFAYNDWRVLVNWV